MNLTKIVRLVLCGLLMTAPAAGQPGPSGPPPGGRAPQSQPQPKPQAPPAGQPQGPPSGPQPGPQPGPPPGPMVEARLIDLDFRGGTVAEYVQAVEKASGETNVAALSDLSRLFIPAIKLRGVEPWTALELLNSLSQDQGGLRFAPLAVSRTGSDRGVVFTISDRSSRGPQTSGPDVAVFSVQELVTGSMKIQDVLTAVQAAIDLLKTERQETKLQYHEGTGLLIMRGPEEQVSAAKLVIEELRERAGRSRENDEMRQAANALRSQLNEARQQLEQARAQIQESAKQAAEWRTRSDVLHEEVDRARQSIAAQEEDVRALRLQLEAEHAGASRPKPGSG